MDKDQTNLNNMIDSEGLINSFRLANTENLPYYFKSIWKDLTRRSDNPDKGVNKIDFSNYYELPGIISTGLFRQIDKDNDGYLNFKEFNDAMITLFTKGTKDLIKFVFEFFDDDNDNYISEINVKSIFQYIPLQNKNFANSSFKDRYESQEEMHSIVSSLFKSKEKIDYQEFEDMTIKENSTVFLYLIVFLLSKKPFNESTIGFYDIKTDLDNDKKEIKKNKEKTLIASPNLLSKFVPGNKILNSPIMSKEKENLRKIYNENSKDSKLMYTKSTELFTIKDKENMYMKSDCNDNNINLLNPTRQENIKSMNGIISMEVTEELLESLKIEPEPEITYEGYLVKVVDDKLKKLWFVLYDKYLYCKIIF